MPQWQGKSKGTSGGYRFFVFIIKSFGIKFSYFILRFVAVHYLLFSAKTSKPILSFYRKKLKFSKFKSIISLYQNYNILGQTLIDKTALMAGISRDFSFNFDGEDHLKEIIAQKKGGLLISAHVGNWEAAGHLLKGLNTKVNIVMYDGEDEQIKNYLDQISGEKTFNVIFVNKDLSHIYRITEALNKNELVCIHADRYLPGNKTLECSFFDSPAKFPEGPFILALKLQMPVVYVYAFKEKSDHYHFYSTPIKYFDVKKGDSVQSISNDFAVSLQDMVKTYPEQWFNYYDFWKH